MSTAERIRKAALGPEPRLAMMMSSWITNRQAYLAADSFCAARYLWVATDTERRMLLLFVAEALEKA